MIDITSKDLRTGIKALVAKFTDCPDIRAAYQSGVPEPKSGFCVMTELTVTPHATTTDRYRPDKNQLLVGSSYTCRFQLDFYGELAEVWAKTVDTLFNNDAGYKFLYAYKMHPLYTVPPAQVERISAKKYEPRYMMEIFFAYYPSVAIPQEYFDTASVTQVAADIE